MSDKKDLEWLRRRKEKEAWIRHRMTPAGMLEYAHHLRMVREAVDKASAEIDEAKKHWKADKRSKTK